MYGPQYQAAHLREDDRECDGTDRRVLDWLETEPKGLFLDYGCGSGALLREATARGWKAVGLEIDPDVARRVAIETGCDVVSDVAELPNGGVAEASVVHLGDVLEHLTALEAQFPRILGTLTPGGLLLAQGPLEGNSNLFQLGMRLARWLRGSPPVEMPPYHVLLATTEGQRAFLQRFGLVELEFEVTEVAWPAPSRFSLSDLLAPRRAALFVLRRVSMGFGRVVRRQVGNRFFYAGRRVR
jgi:SAM-dependent methyltransferase